MLDFAEDAARRGARVLQGCCLPLVEDLPYGAVLEILNRLGEAQIPTGPGERHRFFRHVAETLAGHRPTVAVVEDLHWADASTRDLLVFLARALRAAPVLLVGTVRSDETAPGEPLPAMLTELARSGRVTRLRLAPLGREEVAEQLAGLLGAAPDAALVRRVYARADGNPFFVEEMLAAGPSGRAVPPTVTEAVLGRLAGLAPVARQVAAAAAVIGRSMDHAVLAAVCGLPVGRLEAGLREALAQRLLVATGEGYAFRHALVREAVYAGLLPGERVRLHAQVAGARVPMSAAEAAHHWDAAGRPAEALAASLRAAAEAAGMAAPAEAHTHYERVLRLWPQVTDPAVPAGFDHAELLARTAEAASLAGRHERAGDLVAEALEQVSDPLRAALLLERLGRYRWLAGAQAAAWDAYDQASRLVAGLAPSHEGARVLAALAQSLMLRARPEQAIAVARKAIDRGDLAAEGHAGNTLGTCLCGLGRPAEGLPLLRRAVAIALELDDAAEIERGYNNLVECLTAAGRHTEALAAAEEAVAQMRRCGIAPAYEAEFHAYATRALTRLGRWDEAVRTARTALADVEEALVIFVHPHVLPLEIRRGRLAEAAALLERLEGKVRDAGGEPYTLELARHRAELAVTAGDFAPAVAAVEEGLSQRGEVLHSQTLRLTLCALGVRAHADAHAEAILTGRRPAPGPAHADRLVDQAEAFLGETDVPSADPVGQLLLTRAERSRLATPDPHMWAAFAADRDTADDPFLAAYGRFRQAEAILLSRGPRNRAAPLLRRARATARRLGAAPLLAAVDDLAQRAGINLPELEAEAPAAPRAAGAFDLTPREREVMELLGEGLSNGQIAQALFISTKTASVHVSAILRKLGVTTRVQAAAIARRTRPGPSTRKGPG